MSLLIESKKLKRTGYLPAFLAGGFLAAAFPVVYMMVKAEEMTALSGNPVNILMSANWQMMAMLNILISICGACMMYHTEYADNGMQKMSVLPIRQGSMFFGKFLIAALVLSAMVVIEMAVLVGCAKYWFPSYVFDLTEILKTAGFQIVVTLPTVMLMLVIASACKNMWVSLGIGVILVFTLSILPQDNIVLSLFPFASPYQMLSAAVENSRTTLFLAVCGIETVVFGIAKVLYLKARRCLYDNFLSLVGVELKKIRRSKILLILLIPVIMMWIPSIINADMNFDLRGIPITPENNFFIQGFMGMVWFMIPASLVICTVLLNQTERSNKGILKMLSLPISTTKLCLAKFTVLILLAAFQMVMSIGAYYICAAIVTHTQDYNFILEPLYVCKNVCSIYAAAIPMAAVYLAVSTLIQSPIFSVGIGLASIVPSVLMINTKIWFAYPMSYPFYLIMVAYGRAAEGVYETQIAWLPWLPVAVGITILALVVSCMRYGASERR